VLCGLRDVREYDFREYKALAGGDSSRLGTSSPFNIKLESLRLGDFTLGEVAELYGQHTADTGQRFVPGTVEHAYALTAGQPWLVNALAREVVEKLAVPREEPITVEHLEEAKERLVLARATHLDSLAAKLAEPPVQRVIEPVLAGTPLTLDPYDDDLAYVRDLGLIASEPPVRIANPIYREVVARVLSGIENGEFLTASGYYNEAAPQLIFMGYLQRVVNGGGLITREYAIGSGRVDLHVRWSYTENGQRKVQREAVEIKTWKAGRANPLRTGLTQLDRYLDRLQLDSGTLVIFDQRPTAPAIDKRTTITTTTSPAGRATPFSAGNG